MACDSLLTTSVLQVVNLVFKQLSCQNLLSTAGLLQVVSASCNKPEMTSCNTLDFNRLVATFNEIDNFVTTC